MTADAVKPIELPNKPVHVFRLQAGCFSMNMEGWQRPVDKDGKPIYRDEVGNPILHPEYMYRFNGDNIIRTTVELDKLFGEKFLRVSGDPSLVDDRAAVANLSLIADNEKLLSEKSMMADKIRELESLILGENRVSNVANDLSGMTESQIDALAAAEEIDLSGCRTKAKKIAAIEAARAG